MGSMSVGKAPTSKLNERNVSGTSDVVAIVNGANMACPFVVFGNIEWACALATPFAPRLVRRGTMSVPCAEAVTTAQPEPQQVRTAMPTAYRTAKLCVEAEPVATPTRR